MKMIVLNLPEVPESLQIDLGRIFLLGCNAAGVSVNDVRVEWDD
jgi:hypothetical protein